MSTELTGCDLCAHNTGPMFLRARCHMTAPLQAKLEDGILTLRCYIPDCSRVVAEFQVVAIPTGPLETKSGVWPKQTIRGVELPQHNSGPEWWTPDLVKEARERLVDHVLSLDKDCHWRVDALYFTASGVYATQLWSPRTGQRMNLYLYEKWRPRRHQDLVTEGS